MMKYVEKPHVTTRNVSDAPKDVKTMTKNSFHDVAWSTKENVMKMR